MKFIIYYAYNTNPVLLKDIRTLVEEINSFSCEFKKVLLEPDIDNEGVNSDEVLFSSLVEKVPGTIAVFPIITNEQDLFIGNSIRELDKYIESLK